MGSTESNRARTATSANSHGEVSRDSARWSTASMRASPEERVGRTWTTLGSGRGSAERGRPSRPGRDPGRDHAGNRKGSQGCSTAASRPRVDTLQSTSADVVQGINAGARSEEHTAELQSRGQLVCRLLLETIKDA